MDQELIMRGGPRRNLMLEYGDVDDLLRSNIPRENLSRNSSSSEGSRRKEPRKQSSRRKRSSKKDKPIQKLIKRVNRLETGIIKLEKENHKMKLWKRQMVKLSDDLENRYYNKSQIDDTIDNINSDINDLLWATKEMGYKWSGRTFPQNL